MTKTMNGLNIVAESKNIQRGVTGIELSVKKIQEGTTRTMSGQNRAETISIGIEVPGIDMIVGKIPEGMTKVRGKDSVQMMVDIAV